jgi:hypothetical protein
MTTKQIFRPTSYTTGVLTSSLPSSPELRVILAVDIAFLIMGCLGLIYILRQSFFTDRSKRRRHLLSVKSRHRLPCNPAVAEQKKDI